MPVSFSLDLTGKDFTKELAKKLESATEKVLQKNAAALTLKAKTLAPTDMGGLRNAISAPVKIDELQFQVSVNVFYAAYVEFGTGKYAAQYVSTLPSDWQEYARSFKGKKGNGTFDQFLERIIDWVKRKGLAGTYSVKTQRRTGNKGAHLFEDASVAYAIALAIIRKGVRPHPFLYPAYEETRPKIIKDMEDVLKSLGQ